MLQRLITWLHGKEFCCHSKLIWATFTYSRCVCKDGHLQKLNPRRRVTIISPDWGADTINTQKSIHLHNKQERLHPCALAVYFSLLTCTDVSMCVCVTLPGFSPGNSPNGRYSTKCEWSCWRERRDTGGATSCDNSVTLFHHRWRSLIKSFLTDEITFPGETAECDAVACPGKNKKKGGINRSNSNSILCSNQVSGTDYVL